jgi:hypothetical protein
MKNIIIIFFYLFSVVIFSQKKVINKFETKLNAIEISTAGLDDFVLENSNTDFIEIYLFAENANQQNILITAEESTLKIDFTIPEIAANTTVFRKFITKRLERARVLIKIPQNKSVIIFGDNINIESKNYGGTLAIYIEKGILKLNKIKANTNVTMYAGTVYAALKNTNINIISNIGKIKIDDISVNKKYQNKAKTYSTNFSVNSIKATIFVTTLNKK